MGLPLFIIHFHRMFHYKPSIFEVAIFSWKPPAIETHNRSDMPWKPENWADMADADHLQWQGLGVDGEARFTARIRHGPHVANESSDIWYHQRNVMKFHVLAELFKVFQYKLNMFQNLRQSRSKIRYNELHMNGNLGSVDLVTEDGRRIAMTCYDCRGYATWLLRQEAWRKRQGWKGWLREIEEESLAAQLTQLFSSRNCWYWEVSCF